VQKKVQFRAGEMLLIHEKKCKIAPPRHESKKKKLKKACPESLWRKSFMSPKVDSCRKDMNSCRKLQFHVGLGESTKPDMNMHCGDMKLQNPDMKMTT